MHRLAVEICTEGKGREFASSSFSHPSSPPVQHFVPGFSSSDTDPYAALRTQLSDLSLQFSEMIIARLEAMQRKYHNNMVDLCSAIRCLQRSLDDFFSRRGWPLPVPNAYARPLPPTGPPFDPWMAPQDASMAYQPVAEPEKMWMKKKMLDSSLFLMYDKKGKK